MTPLYMLVAAFTISMVVLAVRRGQANPWLWIILFFPPLGGVAYLVTELISKSSLSRLRFRPRVATADEQRHAKAEVLRLDTASAWSEYATVLRARNELAAAADAAERALERDPTEVAACYELGRSQLGLGKLQEASDALELVVRADRAYDYHDALLALAKAREGLGDLPGARAAFAELAERTSRPEVLWHLADLEERLGDKDAARTVLERMLHEAELAPRFSRRVAESWARRGRTRLRRLGG